ncbi:MAG: response regulator transcription factor [Proteobacteria bacterium]|nr:response regulator transcription factor [Pseudomonadota bacterium]
MKVLLVDQQPLILAALRAIIESICAGLRVSTATAADQARSVLAREPEHDLVLLDLELDDTPGFTLLAEWREAYPELPVVVMSRADRAEDVVQAIDLGAMGFLPKRLSTAALADALQLVLAGGIYVPPVDTAAAASAAAHAPQAPRSGSVAPLDAIPYDKLGITPRQADVLAMLLQGRSNKDIARRLDLSVETVKDHVGAVLRALGVTSRTQAVLAVSELTQRAG